MDRTVMHTISSSFIRKRIIFLLFCSIFFIGCASKIPVPVEQEYELFAWVKDIDGKKITTESVIKSQENTHVESRGLFIDLGENAFKHFAPEKNYP